MQVVISGGYSEQIGWLPDVYKLTEIRPDDCNSIQVGSNFKAKLLLYKCCLLPCTSANDLTKHTTAIQDSFITLLLICRV